MPVHPPLPPRGAQTPKKDSKKPRQANTPVRTIKRPANSPNKNHKRTKQSQTSDCGKRKHNKCASEINKDKKAKPNKNSKIKKVTLKVVSKNLGGRGSTPQAVKERDAFCTECMENMADIILIQETHCASLSEFKKHSPMGWKAFHSGTSTQSAGVGILINPKSNIKPAVAAHEIIPGRAMAITCTQMGGGRNHCGLSLPHIRLQ